MIQRLLFGLMIFSASLAFAQVPLPPPPCGLTGAYGCDFNDDGFATFNLVDLFDFLSFCPQGEVEEDYHSMVFYESQEDLENQINPIVNPEAYVNITPNSQSIYYRANKINPSGGDEYIARNDQSIEVVTYQKANKPSSFVLCDTNNNGINTFVLFNKDSEILAGLDSILYRVKYYATLIDAQNKVNELPRDGYTNVTNPQMIYARMDYGNSSGCEDIVEMNLVVQENCSDITVYLTSQAPPRPGFDYINYLEIRNLSSSLNVSGSVEFIHDASTSFINVSGVDSGNTITNTSTGFILNFNNLEKGEKETIAVRMNLPVSTDLGTLITNSATYSTNDSNIYNNVSELSEVVIGSYDPNDILESHGPEILHSSFGSSDYLYYTIRFQNVGTADAINVSIDNTLDSRLDKSTIQMLSSSHSNVFTRTDNQLNWQFDDIHLPSEDMDEPNSHGYVYYKIKPMAGYNVGDIIPNTAEIYFDFNPAVITNTFETEFITTLSNTDFKDFEFSMFPNPAKNTVELKFNKLNNNNNNIHTAIYDIQGKLILNSDNQLKNSNIKLDVSALKSGIYFLKVTDGMYKLTQKLIIE
ncbi:T9SS type A sorting domain-containing protein [Algibacter sp. 2305UL17-15]|uniref:T9SS type A sorting domain-containing protein n=1 Tax=Algibacter sp. 2305UL17-15 TaxID=3231268 RepID=UPI003458A112